MDPIVPPRLHALVDTLLQAFDNTGIGLTVVERRGERLELTYSNRAYREITGYSPEELVGKGPLDMLAPSERDRMNTLRRGVLPDQTETVLVARDGTEVPVEISLCRVPAAEGGADTVTFVRDIRERKHIEQALRESEARFRILAEASPDSITVIARGKFVYANPASAEVLGFDTPAEMMARPLTELLTSPDETAVMMERIGRITRGETLPPREYRARRKDGSVTIHEISTSLIFYDGQPAILSFGRDTRERRAFQAELLRTDRLATLGMVAASVAHEINNPLTYTLINLDRLAHTVPDLIADPQVRREVTARITEAREGGERVRTIVRDLLTVARQDQGIEPVEVEGPLATAIKLAGPSLAERARVIRRGVPVPPVAANVARLSQVFLNLLLNALDAFDAPAEGNEVTVDVGRAGDEVLVTIGDNGRGIPADDRDRIFEPFFTTKALGVGTGLGLAICASIVASLGGRIDVASEPGAGTRMTVRLPIHPTGAGPPDPGPRLAAEPAAGVRVAVIDDDQMLVEAVASLVATRHVTEPFTDPRAALEHLAAHPTFDHVLCDLHMPGLNGAELYVRLRERRPEYRGRFTFITGGALTGLAAELVGRGEVGLLPKPFDMRAVLAAVERGSR